MVGLKCSFSVREIIRVAADFQGLCEPTYVYRPMKGTVTKIEPPSLIRDFAVRLNKV